MSDDFHERTTAIAQWIGQWAWVIAPLFWIISKKDPECLSDDVAVRQLAIWVAFLPRPWFCNLHQSNSTLDEDYELKRYQYWE